MSAGQRDSTGSWVPHACILPVAEQPQRVAEFDGLFSATVLGLERPEKTTLRLELTPTAEVAADTAALMMREAACCSFFTFTLTTSAGQLRLELFVPAARVAVLDALEIRAAQAIADRRPPSRS